MELLLLLAFLMGWAVAQVQEQKVRVLVKDLHLLLENQKAKEKELAKMLQSQFPLAGLWLSEMGLVQDLRQESELPPGNIQEHQK